MFLGFEADFGKMDLSGATTATQTYPCCAPTAFTVAQTAETSWLFTARPRVGWFLAKFLLYETGGLALTSVKYSALFTDTFATAHESASLQEKRPGWAVGGGGEFKFSSHWSVKGEYLYTGLRQSIRHQHQPYGLYAAHSVSHKHFHPHRRSQSADRARRRELPVLNLRYRFRPP